MLSTHSVMQKLDYTVPDWNQVRRKGLAVRRDLRDALSNLVRFLPPRHSRCPLLYPKQHLLQSKSALNGNVDMSLMLQRTADSVNRQAVQKVSKVSKTKGQLTGRTYTSRYRGVHQTFPTKRWEAQFR